jgi:hypothetical protein
MVSLRAERASGERTIPEQLDPLFRFVKAGLAVKQQALPLYCCACDSLGDGVDPAVAIARWSSNMANSTSSRGGRGLCI